MLHDDNACFKSCEGAWLMLAKAFELVFGNQDVMVFIVTVVVFTTLLVIITDLFRARGRY